jgi:hypothetical protein
VWQCEQKTGDVGKIRTAAIFVWGLALRREVLGSHDPGRLPSVIGVPSPSMVFLPHAAIPAGMDVRRGNCVSR